MGDVGLDAARQDRMQQERRYRKRSIRVVSVPALNALGLSI